MSKTDPKDHATYGCLNVQIGPHNILNLRHVIDIELVRVPGRIPDEKLPQIKFNVDAGMDEGSPTQFYVDVEGPGGESDIMELWDFLCNTCTVRVPSIAIKTIGMKGFQR